MGAGVLLISTYGIGNFYFTKSPSITYFKFIYKRYSNFSMEFLQQFFNKPGNFNNKISCNLPINGDLINKIYLVVILPKIESLDENIFIRWYNYVGFNIIKNIELIIDGKLIDRHNNNWLYIYNELQKNGKDINKLIGNVVELTKFEKSKNKYKIYVPLSFWFNKYISNSLPIVALSKSEILINIEFNHINKCLQITPSHYIHLKDSFPLFIPFELIKIDDNDEYIIFVSFDNTTLNMGYTKLNPATKLKPNSKLEGIESKYQTYVYSPDSNIYKTIISNSEINNFNMFKLSYQQKLLDNINFVDSYLLINYIYLDKDERKKFIDTEITYIIDILQIENSKNLFNLNNKINIGLSKLTKEIFIFAQLKNIINDYHCSHYNFTTSFCDGNSIIKTFNLNINGIKREISSELHFYNYLQSYLYHTNNVIKGLLTYSFALLPFEIQPTGFINFSQINNCFINLQLDKIFEDTHVILNIYALSYNLLLVKNGTAKLLFNY